MKPLTYRGKKGCTDPFCTVGPGYPDSCYGWHCAICHQRCSMMGHHCQPLGPQTSGHHPPGGEPLTQTTEEAV